MSSKQGHVAFPLGKHLPALKAAATIYSFALENTRDVYHCLILPSGEQQLHPHSKALKLCATQHVQSSAGSTAVLA